MTFVGSVLFPALSASTDPSVFLLLMPRLRRLPHSIVLCRFSIPQQLDSVAKLLQYDWLHVLPGHGRPAHLRDASHRLEAVSKLLQHHNHTTPAAAAQQQQAAETKAAAR